MNRSSRIRAPAVAVLAAASVFMLTPPTLAEPEDTAAAAAVPDKSSKGTPLKGAPIPGYTGTDPKAARFMTEDEWQLAGYNLEEIVYTVWITSQDGRILKCRTQMHGWSVDEDGSRSEITDMQLSTVFPNQRTQVGTWTGLDQKSGATYKTVCRPV